MKKSWQNIRGIKKLVYFCNQVHLSSERRKSENAQPRSCAFFALFENVHPTFILFAHLVTGSIFPFQMIGCQQIVFVFIPQWLKNDYILLVLIIDVCSYPLWFLHREHFHVVFLRFLDMILDPMEPFRAAQVEFSFVNAFVGYLGREMTEKTFHGIFTFGSGWIDFLCPESEIRIVGNVAVENAF